MVIGEILTWFALSILGGIKSLYGIDLWNGKECSISQIWVEKRLYLLSAIWIAGYLLVWIGSGRSVAAVQTADLLCTYMILALVDGRCKIVPGSILLCYFSGQMLTSALYRTAAELLYVCGTGILFTAGAYALTWLSKEKVGMGDAKLLGVTAMTAGWVYTIQILIFAMVLSFIYSIGLLVFAKKSMQDAFPFVPFLAAGMAIHLAFFVL